MDDSGWYDDINTAIANEYALSGYPIPIARREYIRRHTIGRIHWPVWLLWIPFGAGIPLLLLFGWRTTLFILGGVYALRLLELIWQFVAAWNFSHGREWM